MRIGVIGTGQIGSMLVSAAVDAGHAGPIYISNRSPQKALALRDRYPKAVSFCDDTRTVAKASDTLLLCVKSKDALDILREIAGDLREDQTLLSTNSNVSNDDMERMIPCKVAKLIPSITQYTRMGVELVMLGSRFSVTDSDAILTFLATLGTPVQIAEDEVRIYSDLTSCGPAFAADWLRNMARGAAERGVPPETAEFLLTQMIRGVAELLARSDWGFDAIVDRIALPGGVTSAGLDVLRSEAESGLFTRLFDATATRQQHLNEHGHK